MRKHASDRVKFLNQATIERLLGDDNCYSQSSGEYCETALRERLMELKTAKAERMGSRGYDKMLIDEKAKQGSSVEAVGMFAAKPRYVSIPVPDSVKIKVEVKTVKQIKFIIRW